MRRSAIYILFAVLLSFGVRFLLHEGIRQNKEGVYGKFSTVFREKNNFNTVFLGSSRAETHFDCSIFDSINGTSSYNLGMEGASIELSYHIFKAYLQKSAPPENVILSVDHIFNYEKADTVFMYPRYFPYMQNKELYSGLNKIDRRFSVFRFVPFYSMAHMGQKYVQASLRGYLKASSALDSNYRRGFFPFENKIYLPENPEKFKAIPDEKIDAWVDSFAVLCAEKKSSLMLVITPVHREYYRATEGIEQNLDALARKSAKYGFPLYNYTNDAFCKEDSMFYDGFHLNGRGAGAFSRRFSFDFRNKVR
jgi:hypothetical protein